MQRWCWADFCKPAGGLFGITKYGRAKTCRASAQTLFLHEQNFQSEKFWQGKLQDVQHVQHDLASFGVCSAWDNAHGYCLEKRKVHPTCMSWTSSKPWFGWESKLWPVQWWWCTSIISRTLHFFERKPVEIFWFYYHSSLQTVIAAFLL